MSSLSHFENAVFRYRSIDALLGEFEELERQTVYFSKPEKLNDPMEGLRQVYWRGDRTTWRNLLRHYVICLHNRLIEALLTEDDGRLAPQAITVFQSLENFTTPQARSLCKACIDAVESGDLHAALLDLLANADRDIGLSELQQLLYETSAAMAPGAEDALGKKRKAKTGLSLEDVRRRMHLMRGQELYILNSGHLKPRPSPVVGQYSFEVTEVDHLMDKIMSRVIVPRPKGLVPLAKAYRRAGCSIVQIFPLLVEGKLKRIGMAKGKAGIAGLLVCSDEVRRLLPRPPAKGLTKQQVEKALRTTSRVVNRLLDHGHLPHFVEKHGTVSQRKVSEADLKAFMTQYVSTYRLSQEWNFGALGVQRRLADLGVRPAFDKGQIKASFYHRADVPDRLPT